MGPVGGAGAAVTLYAVAGVRGGLHAHPHVLRLMASLSPSFLHHFLRREGERELVCVVGRPSKRLKRGRNKTDRWREEGEGEGGGGGVPRPLILAHFHRDWVTRTVPTHTRTHSARHQGFPVKRSHTCKLEVVF